MNPSLPPPSFPPPSLPCSHRNAQVRKLTSQLIFVCVERFGPQKLLQSARDVEKALPAILKLVGDNAPEARYHARKALNCLRTQPEFDHVTTQMLSPSLLRQLKSAVDFIKTKVRRNGSWIIIHPLL